MFNLLYIDWQPSLELFHIGALPIRLYSLCWIVGILLAYLIVQYLYRRQGIDPVPDKHGIPQHNGKFDPLLFYCFVGVLLGARLGHCIFYDPAYYFSSLKHVIEILIPVQFATESWDWVYTGYAGLASHGGTAGLFLALLLYCHRNKVKLMTVLDMIGIAAPATAGFIRLGNLMNSEIIGDVTTVPWAFIFHTRSAMVDGMLVPRHPSQLYEAIAYFTIFVIGWIIYKRHTPQTSRIGTGFYFGFCLTTIFLFRFFIEFLKEAQGGADDGSTWLDMGQILSIPFIIVGIYCMMRWKKFKNQ